MFPIGQMRVVKVGNNPDKFWYADAVDGDQFLLRPGDKVIIIRDAGDDDNYIASFWGRQFYACTYWLDLATQAIVDSPGE